MNKVPRRPKTIAEINITPFTDVILVLLIIFMVITPLISQSNIRVDLPQAKSGAPVEGGVNGQAQTEITVTSEGMVYLDGGLVTRRELKDKMKSLHGSYPGMEIVLRADRSVKFKSVIEVLDQLNELGMTKLNIAAAPEQ